MKEVEKMLSGLLYQASDETLSIMRDRAKNLMYDYNQLRPNAYQKKDLLLRDLLGKAGENVYINQPLYVDYGKHISIGNDFFANYDCTFLDVAHITIGNNVMFGPKVSLLTATHPLDKDIRNEQYEYGLPITIKNDVWIGGNVVVNPGVTIGCGVVVGSGSVVTKDLPDDTLCYGNPCRVIRKLTEEDKIYWEKQKAISLSNK
ncbi:maltose O-acetyltransferase [Tenericutes bacterium MZ-XQ]|jgi:maltose O-acetyltransferase|nr:maltose O-acetyltransferase [Tenericutes bacterium MZ-XQ]